MTFSLKESQDTLTRTPAILEALLSDSSPGWHSNSEGPNTWSARDVLGHLIHGEETDWIPRTRIILEHGLAQTFVPFDRFAQDERFAEWSLQEMLERFREVRFDNLEVLKGWDLTEAQLDLQGSHPDFGAVTLRQLLATWTVHDLVHLAQMSRVMAKAYRDEVGPWRAYLSFLNQ